MIVGDQHAFDHVVAPWSRRWGRLCRLVLVVLALVTTLPLAPAHAADRGPLTLTGPADAEIVGQHFEYTLDTAWQLSPGDLVGPSAVAMQPLLGAVPDFGYTPALIWLRLDVVNAIQRSEWRFLLQANFTQEVSVYKVAADGSYEALLELDTKSPFSARPVAYPQMVAPFELAPGEAATLLVAYYSQGSSRLSMSVETPDSFAAQAGIAQAKSFAFYGMMLVMITLATVALVLLRQIVFAAYAAYLSSILLYMAHADGIAFQYLWPGLPEFNSNASTVGGSSVMIFGALFAITFLQTRRHHPIMLRLLVGVIATVLVVDAALWAIAPQLLKQLLVVMISLSVLCFLAAGIVAARKRFREVRFYLFAWFAGLIPAVMFTARFAFGIETTLITPYDTIRIALVVDALMMGLALFDRYNYQRQSFLEESLVQARRNLALSDRLAALEEQYEEATAVARRREESVKDTVHDLRQPMHALRLSLRQMLRAKAGKAEDATQIESALAYMEKLVAERLAEQHVGKDSSSAPDVPVEGSTAEPGLHDVLRGVASMFAPEAEEKGLALRLVLAAPDGPVEAYPLMRIAANLVSNAIKYTREGRVVIALRRHGSGHRIEVHDTGPGLSGAAFEQALQRNARLDRDRDVAEGTGLGLSVATQVADANGWRLSSCVDRRTGASIRLDLPGVAAVTAAPMQAAAP
jgi:signal transduction histidine kinase